MKTHPKYACITFYKIFAHTNSWDVLIDSTGSDSHNEVKVPPPPVFSCHPSFGTPCSPNPCVSTLRDTTLLHIIFSPTLCMLFLKIKMQFLLNVRNNNNVLYLKNATLMFFIFRTQQICNWYTITGVMLRNYVSQNPLAFFVIGSSLYNRSSSSLACIHLVDEFFMWAKKYRNSQIWKESREYNLEKVYLEYSRPLNTFQNRYLSIFRFFITQKT